MSDPHSEQAYEHYEDNKHEIAEEYLNSDGISLADVGEFVINNPKLLSEFLEHWLAIEKNDMAVSDYYMASLPDNDEDSREDR